MPVIAAINGPAIGAGLCMAMGCDIRLAATSAKMGVTFVRLGLHPVRVATALSRNCCNHCIVCLLFVLFCFASPPFMRSVLAVFMRRCAWRHLTCAGASHYQGMGATHFMPAIVGPQAAARMLLTGDVVDGTEAQEMGLVLKAVPGEELMDEAYKLAESIASAGPEAVRSCVRSIRMKQVCTCVCACVDVCSSALRTSGLTWWRTHGDVGVVDRTKGWTRRCGVKQTHRPITMALRSVVFALLCAGAGQHAF